ncbi:MAG: Crp/Fnr family transcriptional regulator [Leptolyngbya sp. SIO1D8]|nr:Crp/Fnr family transcriptional regulator [Leptolyngbya sp. SIO1D8]
MAKTSSQPYQPFSVLKTFRRKEPLPLIVDRIWRIEQGIVRTMTWNEQGHITTFGIWGRGDIVGQPLTRSHPYQMECLTPVVATDIGLGSGRYWQKALLNHLWLSEELFSIVHQTSVSERLMQLLHWLAQRFGTSLPQGQLLEPFLTHQQLAEIIGSGRVTVTRLLACLENQGRLIRANQVAINPNCGQRAYSRRAILLPHNRFQF